MLDYAVFILTHGRANKVITYDTLRKHGYTGPIYVVVDDLDSELDLYRDQYKDQCLVFSKADIASRFDCGDNFRNNAAIFYARNACFDLAESVGVKYFIEMDDDYGHFSYKFDTHLAYLERYILSLDKVFSALIEYFTSIDALSIAMAQNGDFIGGGDSGFASAIRLKRKAMNSFICSTDRRFNFVGKIK